MRRLSDRRVAAIFSLVLASGLCVGLAAARAEYAGNRGYDFLVWNLVLAWAPFVLALAVYDGYRRGRSRLLLGALGALWLLFLPNAPYILTDLVHLGKIPGAPLWYDAALIAAFAFTGLVLGLGSLYLVQAVLARAAGAGAAWAASLGVLALCGIGMYVGRFLRLNSWDALVQPGRLLELAWVRLADPLGNPRLIAVSLLFAAFLTAAYLVLYSAAGLRLDPERRRR